MRKKKAKEINNMTKGLPDLDCDVCQRKKVGCTAAHSKSVCGRFLSAEFDAKDKDPNELWEENRKKQLKKTGKKG